jgi:E3 ubiquitin-protein ligase synoviolin
VSIASLLMVAISSTFCSADIPMPTPPANFSGLTDEELRRMEGNEREAVESRIQVLRNVHTLLDAAIVQLQQYSSIAG